MPQALMRSMITSLLILFALPGPVLADSTGGSKIAIPSSSAEMTRATAKSALARQSREAASQDRIDAYRFDDEWPRFAPTLTP